jgi:hypothetical protein
MLFTVAEGWAIAASVTSLVIFGVIAVSVERQVRSWVEERSRTKARRIYIDAERQYNDQHSH